MAVVEPSPITATRIVSLALLLPVEFSAANGDLGALAAAAAAIDLFRKFLRVMVVLYPLTID
jgi:hypothetical protein